MVLWCVVWWYECGFSECECILGGVIVLPFFHRALHQDVVFLCSMILLLGTSAKFEDFFCVVMFDVCLHIHACTWFLYVFVCIDDNWYFFLVLKCNNRGDFHKYSGKYKLILLFQFESKTNTWIWILSSKFKKNKKAAELVDKMKSGLSCVHWYLPVFFFQKPCSILCYSWNLRFWPFNSMATKMKKKMKKTHIVLQILQVDLIYW